MARKAASRLPTVLASMMVFYAPVSVPAQEISQNFIDHLQHEITCQSLPEPTATLLYLSRNKHIDAKKGQRIDSETCWIIYPPMKVDGIAFSHICAATDDPLLIDLFPLLYYRGTGSSPGTGLRLITDNDEAAVDDWLERAKKRLGLVGETKLDIGEPTFVKGKTEISCNSTSFRSNE